VQLDAMPILDEPRFALWCEVVAGSVVDAEEDLAPAVLDHQPLQESPDEVAVEDSKPVDEGGVRERNGREQVRVFSIP